MNNIFNQLALLLRDSDILMKEIENEYNTAIENIRFDGEEEFLHQYYKKILTSVYRMRNNAAALLLRYKCTCLLSEDEITIIIDDKKCTLSANAIKTILQDDYQKIMDKNKTDNPETIITIQKTDSVSAPVPDNKNEQDSVKVDERLKTAGTEDKYPKEMGKTPDTKKPVIKVQERKPFESSKPKKMDNEKLTADERKAEVRRNEPKDSTQLFDQFEDTMFFDEEDSGPSEKNNTEKEPEMQTPMQIDTHKLEEPVFDFDDDDLDIPFTDDLEVPLTSGHDELFVKEPTHAEADDKKNDLKDMEEDDSFFFFDEEPEKVSEPSEKRKSDEISDNTNKSGEIPIIHQRTVEQEIEEDDIFGFMEEDILISDKGKEKQPDIGIPTEEAATKFNHNILSQVKDDNKIQPESEKPSTRNPMSKFNLSQEEFQKPKTPAPVIKDEPVHKFTAEAVSGDTEDLLDQLKKGREAYDKEELERKLNDVQNVKLKGNVIDLSTGNVKSGDIDAEQAIGKVSNVARDIITASKKDRLMDAKLDENTRSEKHAYELQRDSDFVRMKDGFILDDCKIAIVVYEEGSIKTKDKVKLIIAPISIPETGTALVTDICAYMECNGEIHGASVAPGKNSTLIIRGEDYTFLIRGSWENGDFKTAISIVGNGTEVKSKIEKKEIRPSSMDEIGIGHNVIYADHATIAHIIPVTDQNDFGDYSNFMAVVVKDYGIDQDVDCKVLRDTPEMIIKGEKYRYAVSTSWDNDIFKVNFKTLTR